MKYVYLINPKIGVSEGDRATFVKDSDSVTLKAGVPTEVPASLEFRVKGNPHFQLVEEKAVTIKDPPAKEKGEK